VIRKDRYAGFPVQFYLTQRSRSVCAVFAFSALIGGNGEHNMLTIRRRGDIYHADLNHGNVHVVRGTLGTQHRDVALRYAHRLEIALAEGPTSTEWQSLKERIPPRTFSRFAQCAGLKETPLATWHDLRELYASKNAQKIRMGKLKESTNRLYERFCDQFELFLTKTSNSMLLKDMTEDVATEFKERRIKEMMRNSHARGATSVSEIGNTLRYMFALAVQRGMMATNPFPFETKPKPKRPARPFTGDEVIRMRKHAGDYLLTFEVLRNTGFRRSDAVDVRWEEAHFDAREIQRVTIKELVEVFVPMSPELFSILEKEYCRRKRKPKEPILLDPLTGKPYLKTPFENALRLLGERAGVRNVHPHRFRSTFAVDLLLKGVPLPSVARILGDTVQTIVKHYLPYVEELREHARLSVTTGKGIEEFASHQRHNRMVSADRSY
jgi:integrase